MRRHLSSPRVQPPPVKKIKFTGELKPNGGVTYIVPPTGTNYPVGTAWLDSIELLPCSKKSRMALAWLKTYDSSEFFERVFIRIKIPSGIPEKQAVCLAANKAFKHGKAYSWIMWARNQIREKYSLLCGDPEFSLHLRNLSAEWMPKVSADGRSHIVKALKLGSFEAQAFPVGIMTEAKQP